MVFKKGQKLSEEIRRKRVETRRNNGSYNDDWENVCLNKIKEVLQ